MFNSRDNLFETNSSSCHTLVIKNESKNPNPYDYNELLDEDIYPKSLVVELQNYDNRVGRILTTPREKLEYLLTLDIYNSMTLSGIQVNDSIEVKKFYYILNLWLSSNLDFNDIFTYKDTTEDIDVIIYNDMCYDLIDNINYLKKITNKTIRLIGDDFPFIDHESNIPSVDLLRSSDIPSIEDYLFDDRVQVYVAFDGDPILDDIYSKENKDKFLRSYKN